MGVIGVGIDVVDLARFEASLRRTPGLVQRLFAPDERGLPPASLAARFAAKEAVVKVLRPTGGVRFGDIEILVGADGAPEVHLHGEMERRAAEIGVVDASLSLSHDHDLAAAVLVAVVTAAPQAGPVPADSSWTDGAI